MPVPDHGSYKSQVAPYKHLVTDIQNTLYLHYDHLTRIILMSTHGVPGVGCLQEFLLEIQASPNVEYGELADILVRQAQSADEVTRMTALRWLRAFVSQAKDQLMPYYAIILAAVLPNVSHNNQDICQVQCVCSRGLCCSPACT